MAKTKAQVEKQKRATEKRKKLEKTILKIASEMPDEDSKQGPIPAVINPKVNRGGR